MIRGPRPVEGPLACYAAGLRPALLHAGLNPPTVAVQYGVFRQLSGWLGQDQLVAADLTDAVAAEFAAARRAAGYDRVGSLRGLAPLLTYLRGLGAIPAGSPTPPAPGTEVLSVFVRYLTEQRRLAPLTVVTTVGIVRRFLITLPACDAAALSG